jgi:hypothetical protein
MARPLAKIGADQIPYDPEGTSTVIKPLDSIVKQKATIFPVAQDAVTDTAAASVATYYTTLTTTAAAVPTLADGTEVGQLKKVQLIVRAVGDATFTPANLSGGTTITFATVGDVAELVWDNTNWVAVALYNIVDGATAPVLA